MTIADLRKILDETCLDPSTEVKVYDPVDCFIFPGPYVVQTMFESGEGDLWTTIADAQDVAAMADCVADHDERAVTGKLKPVLAISLKPVLDGPRFPL